MAGGRRVGRTAGHAPTVVTMISERLWPHPAWAGHLEFLRDVGVRFLDPVSGTEGARAVKSGSGPNIVSRFEPRWLLPLLDG